MGTERERPVGALGALAEAGGKPTGMTAKTAAEGDIANVRQGVIESAPGTVTLSSRAKLAGIAVVADIGDIASVVGHFGEQRVEPQDDAEGASGDASPGQPDG